MFDWILFLKSSYHPKSLLLTYLSAISQFLDGVLTEHVELVYSLDSQLQIYFLCSIRFPSRNREIFEKPYQLNFILRWKRTRTRRELPHLWTWTHYYRERQTGQLHCSHSRKWSISDSYRQFSYRTYRFKLELRISAIFHLYMFCSNSVCETSKMTIFEKVQNGQSRLSTPAVISCPVTAAFLMPMLR